MFTKYIGRFGKAEAEWAREVLDMHDGDEARATEAIRAALYRIIACRANDGALRDLTTFEQAVAASYFANRNWWQTGLAYLEQNNVSSR
jgi:hypothetical protein